LLGLTKVKIWAVVDQFGDIKQIAHEFPKLDEEEYSVPMTLTLGHSWREGFDAWWANAKTWF
jgi:hypothetical protein